MLDEAVHVDPCAEPVGEHEHAAELAVEVDGVGGLVEPALVVDDADGLCRSWIFFVRTYL